MICTLALVQGYLVGNGVADSMYDGNALVPFAHGMGLISDQLFEVCLMDSYLFSTSFLVNISKHLTRKPAERYKSLQWKFL